MISTDRRDFLAATLGLTAGLAMPTLANSPSSAGGQSFRRIGTEEGFLTRDIFAAQLELLDAQPELEPGFAHFWHSALGSAGELVTGLSGTVGGGSTAALVDMISSAADALGSESSVTALGRLFDIGEGRIAQMDAMGVSMQVLSLASPGVQVLESARGTELAAQANDELAAAVRAHPKRFAGLAAVAPQNPEQAALELRRCVRDLGMKGVIVNSHTRGEYLDEEKYRPLLATIAELKVPLYLHPRTPSPAMLEPFTAYPGLAGATFGFSVETGLHALRLILSGVFDDYPDLTVVLGHLGEGLPFWIERVDNRNEFLHSGPGPKPRRLLKKPSDYLRENFYVTTSGMESQPALVLTHSVVGAQRMMFATDYPMENGEHIVAALDATPFSDADKARIYHENAEKLFQLAT